MVIDSSALLAILLDEPEADRFIHLIAQDSKRLVCAVSALEAAMVIQSRKGPAGLRELDRLLQTAALDVVSMGPEQVELARKAYARYGTGRHPAGLNLGDCCSYALSRYTGEPLLFKTGGFDKTDLAPLP